MTKEPIIRHVSSILAGTWGDEPDDSVNTVACLRVADFDYSRLTNVDPKTRRKISQADISQKMLKSDDILIEKSGGGEKTPVGRAVVVTNIKQPTTYANFIERVRLMPSLNSRYANYALSHLYSRKVNTKYIKQNTGIQNLDVKAYLNEPIVIPGIKEQEKAVNYLDTKTQTLDKILTAKNHTHTHLSELRQAIITNAVLGAGGVAMNLQNTNIPWISKIPAHWQVEKIKGVADIVLGKMLQSTEKEGYVLKPYLRAQNIRWENVDVSSVNEMWFSPNEISQYRLKEGDILVSEGGEVGRAAMWHNELDECYIQNSVNRLRVHKKKILPEYLLYVLESYGQAKVFENTVNRVSIAHLTREKLKEYAIPLPPLDEQREIVTNIQKRLSNIDKADTVLQKSISQLEEYRSSLISNVVGGKVEV